MAKKRVAGKKAKTTGKQQGKGTKIVDQANHNANGFAQNPQNINRKGRPKKSLSSLNEELKGEGYEGVTKGVYVESLQLIMNLDEARLMDIVKDLEQPYYLRLMIGNLNDPKQRAKMMSDYRDYALGKATESVEVKGSTEIIIDLMSEDGNYL